MQKIFIVQADGDHDSHFTHIEVNEFIRNGGFIISVTPQKVASGNNIVRGRWLVVADNGKGDKIEL